MNNNLKIVLKVIVVVVILLNLPFQQVYSENVENIVSSLMENRFISITLTKGKNMQVIRSKKGANI